MGEQIYQVKIYDTSAYWLKIPGPPAKLVYKGEVKGRKNRDGFMVSEEANKIRSGLNLRYTSMILYRKLV